MSLKPTSRTNPCPICEDVKGNCRHHDEEGKHLCMGFSDTRKGEIVNGYKCLTHFDLWAAFCLDNSQQWSDEQRQSWLQEQAYKRQQRQVERKEFLAGLLSVEERDKEYRKLSAQLSLNKHHHYTELAKIRGLGEDEIWFAYNQGWIRSWQPGLEVKDLSLKLAGVNPETRILTGVRGIAIAATDGQGHILGHQIASDNRDKFGKYIWLSSKAKGGSSPHLPNAELPLFVWRHPEATKITETWLVEGSLKSLIVALKLWLRKKDTHIQVIGAAGASFAGSPSTLKQALTTQTTRVVKLFPDGGSVFNSHILKNYEVAIDLAASNGFSVFVGWWDQFQKAKNDIDEIPDFELIEYISPSEFFNLADSFEKKSKAEANSRTTHHEPSAVPEERTRDDWAWENWKRSRVFTPDRVIHQKHFEFGEIPDDNAIIGVKSGLGTNKTGASLNKIKETEERWGRGAKLEGYRNNLLLQTIQRGAEFDVIIYHLREDDSVDLLADTSVHQAFCSDSDYLVDGYYAGCDLYLDEAVSVINHIINGGTLGDNQSRAIEVFSKALQVASRVFLLDGNLSDIYVDFIASLAPGKTVLKIENQQKIPPHTIKIVDGVDIDDEIRQRDRSPLIESLCGEDVKPFVYCDSRDRTKVIDKILKDKGRKGFVLNSETAGEDWAKNLLANPNEFIEKNNPDYQIFSPTAESGVSVTINNHFTDKFTFFSGVANTNSQHQGMFRLRDNKITHYVFCPEKSNVRDRSNPRVYSSKKFLEILNDRILHSGFLASQTADNPQRALEMIGAAIARQNDPWWEFAAKLGALDNFEMDNLRECLIYVLEEAGHDVEIVKWEINDSLKKEEQAAKDFLDHQKADELHTAVPYESIEEAQKVAKGNPRKETQRRIELTYLLSRLPEITESETWNSDFIYQCHIKKKDYISRQERFWLVQNADISAKRHEASWYYAATKETFFSARMKGMGHDRIWALKELDILQFVGREYHKNSPEVISFNEKLRQNTDIQKALRICLKPATVQGSERLEIIGNLLQLIGFKNKSSGKKNVGGIRLTHYTCEPDIGNPAKGIDLTKQREAILKSVQIKFTTWMESDKSQVSWVAEEPPSQQPLVPVRTQTEPSSVDVAMQKLQAARTWSDVTQKMLDTGWWFVDQAERDRLTKLHINYLESLEQPRETVRQLQELVNNVSPVELAVQKLYQVLDWSEVDIEQSLLNEAWQLLSGDEQTRLHKLAHRASLEQAAERAIATKANVKEVRFGYHFRSYEILKVIGDGIALVRKCWGDKENCEINLDQLILGVS